MVTNDESLNTHKIINSLADHIIKDPIWTIKNFRPVETTILEFLKSTYFKLGAYFLYFEEKRTIEAMISGPFHKTKYAILNATIFDEELI